MTPFDPKALSQALQAAGLKPVHLANHLGVTKSAVSQWLSGATRPSYEKIVKAARWLRIPKEVITGETAFDLNNQPGNSTLYDGQYMIPILTAVEAGHFDEVLTRIYDNDGDVWDVDPTDRDCLITDTPVGTQAFAAIITGSSMEPTFNEGDLVIIDPSVPPVPGDFVMATQGEMGEAATFKRYRVADMIGLEPVIDLVPDNPDYPTLRIGPNQPGRIVGTMVEHRRFRRGHRRLAHGGG